MKFWYGTTAWILDLFGFFYRVPYNFEFLVNKTMYIVVLWEGHPQTLKRCFRACAISMHSKGPSIQYVRKKNGWVGLEIVFCCYNCLDLYHAQSFYPVFFICFPSSLEQEKSLRPRTCTTFSQHSFPALKNWENK